MQIISCERPISCKCGSFILNKNRSQSANTAYKLQILITSCKYSYSQAANDDPRLHNYNHRLQMKITGCKITITGCKKQSHAANCNHRLQLGAVH